MLKGGDRFKSPDHARISRIAYQEKYGQSDLASLIQTNGVYGVSKTEIKDSDGIETGKEVLITKTDHPHRSSQITVESKKLAPLKATRDRIQMVKEAKTKGLLTNVTINPAPTFLT
jgi:hypothetical protein